LGKATSTRSAQDAGHSALANGSAFGRDLVVVGFVSAARCQQQQAGHGYQEFTRAGRVRAEQGFFDVGHRCLSGGGGQRGQVGVMQALACLASVAVALGGSAAVGAVPVMAEVQQVKLTPCRIKVQP
jgi:hypothetical protein